MAKSLQEQLRQAGLASQKQAVKARKAKNTKEKLQRKGKTVVDETAAIIEQRDKEKLEKDRALNEKRDQAAVHKAVQAQIRQLIELNAVKEPGDQEYRFTHDGVIRTLMVTDTVRQSLIKGQLAIVGKESAMSVVPAAAALKIAERDESWLLLLNPSDDQDDSEDTDDEYADYQIPDDLMW